MTVFHLARANIKEHKGAVASLTALIVLAALLLNIGLTIMTQISVFYDRKAIELNDAHVSVITRDMEQSAAYEQFFRQYPQVSLTDSQDAVLLEGVKFRYGETDLTTKALFVQADAAGAIAPLKLTEQLDAAGEQDIYMTYNMKVSGGYKLGDLFEVSHMDRRYTFRVAGFFESTLLGTLNMGIVKLLLPEQSYRAFTAETGDEFGAVQVSVLLEDAAGAGKLSTDFKLAFSDHAAAGGNPYWEQDMESSKNASTLTVRMISMIFVAFAAVIVLISLIVIVFRVMNSMEEGIVNIGVLKALGYTSKQIMASIILQYGLVALLAGIAGIVLSYGVLPLFGGIIASLSGLVWRAGLEWGTNAASLSSLTVLVPTVAACMSWRIRRLHPVSALRGGIATHSFRQNRFPLAEGNRGGLHVRLACKAMRTNVKQNVTLLLIISSVTFASVFAMVLYYNIASDKTAFIELTGVEISDVLVIANPGVDGRELRASLEQTEGAVGVALLDLVSMKLDGQNYYTNVSDDYGKLRNNTAYEGRHPKHDNEISLSWLIADRLGKSPGDTVEVAAGGASGTYLITGLSQSINNLGLEANMTLAGVQRLLPDYSGAMFHVYLEGVDNDRYIAALQAEFAGSIAEVIDIAQTVESQTAVYTAVVYAVMVMILTVTALVVSLILYMVIKMMIFKRKKEFGLMTAIGFTSGQLMGQVALSIVPVVAAGVTLGCVLGHWYTNPLLELLLSGVGVRNVSFTVELSLTLVLSGAILALAYAISMLVAGKIKRISPYELITD